MTKDSDLTSSQQDFLANHSASQEKENQRKMTEISGKKLLELSKSPDLLFLLEKMLMESLNSISTPYLRTWKVQTTPQGALIFQLRASVQNTKDKESGLLRTPMYPTPRTGGGSRPNRKGGKVLEEEVMIEAGLRERGKTLAQMYPTPLASDGMRSEMKLETHKKVAIKRNRAGNINELVSIQNAKKTGGRLNPNFVERLMGFPMDWTKIDQTELKDSETQFAHKYHTTSDKS